MIEPVSSSIEHVKSGKLRALAVTAPVRWDALPNLPTVGGSCVRLCRDRGAARHAGCCRGKA